MHGVDLGVLFYGISVAPGAKKVICFSREVVKRTVTSGEKRTLVFEVNPMMTDFSLLLSLQTYQHTRLELHSMFRLPGTSLRRTH